MAKKNIASVLSFEKKIVPSDGTMRGAKWTERYEKWTPLKIQEKSVRGTISNRLKADITDDPIKLNAKIENANLQQIDSCALNMDQDTVIVTFTLKILPGVQNPSTCNNQEFNKSLTAVVEDYIKKTGCTELGKRYAVNIANGRFLWRNRVGAEYVEVSVKVLNEGEKKEWVFNAHDFDVHNFNHGNEDIDSLSTEIADTLSGKKDFLLLEINAYSKIGKAQDVYPSEELVLNREQKRDNKRKKSKILYQIDGNAAVHSQKIGNALRTIDTWYPEHDLQDIGPIPIEPYGAVTNLGVAFRNPKNDSDFFTLFDQFALGESINKNDEHFFIACLISGGLFGESGKE